MNILFFLQKMNTNIEKHKFAYLNLKQNKTISTFEDKTFFKTEG